MELQRTAQQATDLLLQKGMTVSLAESCTGGLIAKRIVDLAGVSDVFVGGCVTYANEAKERLIGVSHETLEKHGAVSEETAAEMARGVRQSLGSDIGISVTGIAGPGGGTPEKPVGTVWTAFLVGGNITTCKLALDDCGRAANIEATILETLKIFHRLLCDS